MRVLLDFLCPTSLLLNREGGGGGYQSSIRVNGLDQSELTSTCSCTGVPLFTCACLSMSGGAGAGGAGQLVWTLSYMGIL